jgi:hypothetical protein
MTVLGTKFLDFCHVADPFGRFAPKGGPAVDGLFVLERFDDPGLPAKSRCRSIWLMGWAKGETKLPTFVQESRLGVFVERGPCPRAHLDQTPGADELGLILYFVRVESIARDRFLAREPRCEKGDDDAVARQQRHNQGITIGSV